MKILSQDGKVGGKPRAGSLKRNFRQAVQDNNLFDLKWKELNFTWCNNHMDETFTKERLDRVVTTSNWMNLFNN